MAYLRSRGQRLGGKGQAAIAEVFTENIAAVCRFGRHSSYELARLYECYNIPASDSCTTTGTPVLVYYLSGTINSLGSCSVNSGETIEVDLGMYLLPISVL